MNGIGVIIVFICGILCGWLVDDLYARNKAKKEMEGKE